jgi:tetratricopeptide (TPR) repeat protein
MPMLDEKEPPVKAIQLGVPRVETSNSEMKLPEGWSAELPEAIHAHSAYANFDETFRFETGKLYAERKIEVLKESVPQADWKSYKKWADEADLGKEEYVQLTRPGTKQSAMNIVGGIGAAPDLNGMLKSGEAAGLVKDAYEAVQAGDFKTAKSKLDEARELNEHQPRLWSTYGFLAFRKGEMTEALGDYEKELGFHPDAVNVYRDVVTAYIALGKDADAIAAMRRWAGAEPSNPEPTMALTQALINDEEYTDAVKAAEGGIAGLPAEARKDESLQMLLGTAQMKAGMKEKGAATLTQLLQSDNSVILIGAAYELADAGVDLDLAEAGARSSLKKQEEQSRTWTLDESYGTLRMKSRALIATWDTLGWVLYRQGKMAEAEEYLDASWMSHQDADAGEHLGDLLLKKGERANAANTYMLALSTISPYDPMGKKRAKQTPVEVRLHKKLAAAGGAAAESSFSIEKGDLALQELRKVQLGPANSLSGTAEYKILLSRNGVVRVEPLGAREVSGGAERLNKVSLKGYWPTGSDSRLVRLGFLNCHATTCELIFEP